MPEEQGENIKKESGKLSKISFVFIAVILAVIAVSVITWLSGDAAVRWKEQREWEARVAANDIRDMFAKKLTFTDDDPDFEAVQYFLTDSPNYKETGRIKEVKGLMLHSIGVSMTDAKAMADQFGAPDYNRAGIHGFIDSETGVFYHTLPWNQVAWHAGEGAYDYIGVELCESDAGYYSDDYVFHPDDLEKAQRNAKIAYDTAVKLFARLCLKYEFDPMEDGRIISHSEGSLMGIATQHGDPDEYWINVQTDYTMDGFRRDVWDYMNNCIIAHSKYMPIRQILKKYIYHERS